MAGKRKKVFVALSGGVDSFVAGGLLLERGFDCEGMFMITCDNSQGTQAEAEEAAGRLGIKLHIVDLRKDFGRVIEYFCNEYKRGRTPNPCVFCNRYMKFGRLWDFARANGADLLATGHYARVQQAESDVGLYEGVDEGKEQSYALAMIDKDIFPYIILPLGDYFKDQTREMAARFGLKSEGRKESQEICFIPNDDYVSVLERMCPGLARKGNILDSQGKVLGEHMGVHRFTIGQRRGAGVAMGKPYYVVNIDAESNTVTLGPKEEVVHSKLAVRGVNWLVSEPASAFRAQVKIRYNDRGASGTVIPAKDGVLVEFDAPMSSITPGQLAVFYVRQGDKNRVVGSGWIESAGD